MKLLDLYCKAGGCTKGYQDAGFFVVGVDIDPQPRYCGDQFVLGDTLTIMKDLLSGYKMIDANENEWSLDDFDAISASPPCQHYSEATPLDRRCNHPDLIDPTRDLLMESGKPFVIENVENARHKLIDPITLCGSMFCLPFQRHRCFEISYKPLLLLPPCNHAKGHVLALIDGEHRMVQTPVLCTGGGDGKRKSRKNHRPRQPIDEIRWAMGISWMNQKELSNAIPPAYTRFIGENLKERTKKA